MKFIYSFLLIVSFSLSSEDFYRIGLGSCHDQDMETPAWESLKKENLDSFFFLGDNVYGDIPSGKLRRLINAYDTFKKINLNGSMKSRFSLFGMITTMV